MVKAFFLSRKILALLLLVLVGFVRLPMEERLSEELQAQHLIEEPPSWSVLEGLGQMGMTAAVGGLRSLVASITYLMAYANFEDVNWEGVRRLMWITTRLEPHNRSYWEEAAWHMAINASAYYQRDKKLRPAIRDKQMRDHVQMGKEILEEGLRFLPNDPSLWLRLGQLLQDKELDHRRAAEAYLECYENGGEKYQYAERMAAYEMVKLNDRPSWEKAYEILKKYYDKGMRKAGTSIMRDLPILEERLNIPKDQRVKPLPQDLPHYQPKIPRVPGTALPK